MPYAYGATIEHEFVTDLLYIWVTFRHPMDQTVKPPLALWLLELDDVPVDVIASAWQDSFTILLTSDTIGAVPERVTLEYNGPDSNLQTTWGKDWEPWGPILSTDITGAPTPYACIHGIHIGWSQANAVQNTWYNIVDASIASGPLNRITHDGNGKLTILVPGRYLINYSLTIEVSVANDHIDAGIEKNGSGAAESIGQSHFENKFASTEESLSSSGILDLNVDDTIEISVKTEDNNTPTLSVQSFNLTLVYIP